MINTLTYGNVLAEPLSDDDAWSRMPSTVTGGGQPLPSWAKAVAARLPRTAAAMLELDRAHRLASPIDPILRAKMRWVIARANRCAYSEEYALADLELAGAGDDAIARLTKSPDGWSQSDMEALVFARMHTLEAPAIPDALFVRLRKRYGDKVVAAMVLLGAYGNFQGRIVLGLSLPVEPDGPLAPLDVTFAPGALQIAPIMPAPPAIPPPTTSGTMVVDRDPEWSALTYDELQSRLN